MVRRAVGLVCLAACFVAAPVWADEGEAPAVRPEVRGVVAAGFTRAMVEASMFWADGPLTPIANLKGRTDGNGYLLISGGTYSGADGPLTPIGQLRGRTDANGYLRVALAGGTVSSALLLPDGTVSAPSLAFTNATGTGLYLATTNSVGLATAGTGRWRWSATDGSYLPVTDLGPDVGSASLRVDNVYFGTALYGGVSATTVSTGLVRFANNVDIVGARNAGGTGDLLVLATTGSNAVRLGGTNVSRVEAKGDDGLKVLLNSAAASHDAVWFEADNEAHFAGYVANASANVGAEVLLYRSRGTIASKALVQAGDRLGLMSGWGWDGSAYRESAQIDFIVEDDFSSSTDNLSYIRFRTMDGAGSFAERVRITSAGGLRVSAPAITAGTQAVEVDPGSVTRLRTQNTITPASGGTTNCSAGFNAAALTADCTIATLKAGQKLVGVYAEVTAGFTCSGTCTGTKVVQCGITGAGTEILAAAFDVTATGVAGDADAELGSATNRAGAIQGGYLPSWSATTPVVCRFTSGTGNWGDGAATFVNAGSITFTLLTEQVK